MKYTTKSGLELPPKICEAIEHEQAKQSNLKNKENYWLGFDISDSSQGSEIWRQIYLYDNLTEFYKLYPKKDLDSYGNEIVKGEMVYVADHENMLGTREYEFYGIAEKSDNKYLAYTENKVNCVTYKFCRKITEKQSLKSELQRQMNDLLKQAKEIESKINEI